MRIIYKNLDNSISILTPTPDCLLDHSIESIALKDTPHDLPFWIVEDSIIPADRELRNSWPYYETLVGQPNGYGSKSSEFPE